MNEVERSLATLREMFETRGVATDGALDAGSENVNAVLEAARNDTQVFFIDVPASSIRILYNLNQKFRVQDVRRALQQGANYSHLVFVTRERPSSQASLSSTILQQNSTVTFELFRIVELQVNITKHRLVPRHEVIKSEGEIADIIARYHLRSRYQLPLITSTDPIARFLGLQPGQVVRISRASPSSGTYLLFRCCQKGA